MPTFHVLSSPFHATHGGHRVLSRHRSFKAAADAATKERKSHRQECDCPDYALVEDLLGDLWDPWDFTPRPVSFYKRRKP